MSDRGFSIQELCALGGITLNRPKQKDNDQFSEIDVASNFDIAATQIHVERFTGRVCNWGILNSVRQINQIDILSSTWQMLAHILNLTLPPIVYNIIFGINFPNLICVWLQEIPNFKTKTFFLANHFISENI